MVQNSTLKGIWSGILSNAAWEWIKALGGGLATSLAQALSQYLRHRPVDWWGILALGAFSTLVFGILLWRIQKPNTVSNPTAHRDHKSTLDESVPADPCVGLFSPLQLEAFQLAKDIRNFLANLEPIPPADYSTESRKLETLSERIAWSKRLDSMLRLNFDERTKTVELKLGANNIQMNHTAIIASCKRGLVQAYGLYAAVLTAMAHRLDGVVLDARTDVGG